MNKAYFHLPGLFEFYDLYKVFLPLFYTHREYFYDFVEISSIYGAPADAIWNGGRVGAREYDVIKSFDLLKQYPISARLTFSNSLLKQEHLEDENCNQLCQLLENQKSGGVIITSDTLLDYLKQKYPSFYYVSSTTKVLTDFNDFVTELNRDDFQYVVPDFRLNKRLQQLQQLFQQQKDKVEFLVNECCYFGCKDRKACYENVSRQNLGEEVEDFICKAPNGNEGYRFSMAMKNPGFISVEDIQNIYLPTGFLNFKIEGRNLGSALVLEFLLYYMVKPEYQLMVREEIYLDNMLDLF